MINEEKLNELKSNTELLFTEGVTYFKNSGVSQPEFQEIITHHKELFTAYKVSGPSMEDTSLSLFANFMVSYPKEVLSLFGERLKANDSVSLDVSLTPVEDNPRDGVYNLVFNINNSKLLHIAISDGFKENLEYYMASVNAKLKAKVKRYEIGAHAIFIDKYPEKWDMVRQSNTTVFVCNLQRLKRMRSVDAYTRILQKLPNQITTTDAVALVLTLFMGDFSYAGLGTIIELLQTKHSYGKGKYAIWIWL